MTGVDAGHADHDTPGGGAFWVLPALLGDMTALPHDTRPQIASR